MKLFERLPDSVTVNGKRIRMDFSFRNVLRMMEVLERDDLIPDARNFLALKCLCKRPPKDVNATLLIVRVLLFGTRTAPANEQKITSFEQDAPFIRAAFRQEYGINLWRDDLHWLEFIELLHGLPEGNRYEEILGIRSRPMPAPTKWNAKEREWLFKAKQTYALKMTEEETAKKYEADVAKVFSGLMGIIQKAEQEEVKPDGQ
jgi:hypothetical protein